MTQYGDDLRVVWKDNPLAFHTDARPAAVAAIEAHRQRGNDGFWQMHDLLFANQRALGRADLERYATQIGLDLDQFRNALDRDTHAAAIAQDQALAQTVGATGTPSFFINGRSLQGAQPYERFAALVDEELAHARGLVSSGVPRASVYESLMGTAR
jgi:protein-disulfide isomerase